MNYVQELRPLVGSRPLILVGAAALILDKQGKVLLLRRTDNGAWLEIGDPQFWHLFSSPELY